MSNLWFFRLKRAEQQRRRSSGEQSVGSASVQSAAGVSASSLPAGGGQQSSGSPRGSQVSATLLRAEFDYEEEADNDDYYDHDDHHYNHQHEFYERHLDDPRPASATEAPTAAGQWAPSAQEARRAAGQSSGSSGGQTCNSERRFKNQDASTENDNRRTPSSQLRASWRQQHQRTDTESQEMDPKGAREQQVAASRGASRPQVPQVTIIRSDSTSSYIPMGCGPDLLLGEPVEAFAASASGSSSSRTSVWPAKKQYVVSELNESSGLVESSLARKSKSSSSSSSPSVAAAEMAAPTPTCSPNQQQFGGEPWKRNQQDSHHLHDQLSSGKVPPIHERLLNPNGGPQGLPPADSMDNLASLIPR